MAIAAAPEIESRCGLGQLDAFSSMPGAILSFAVLVVGLQVLLTSFPLGLVQVQRPT